ncbi:MAG: hypothetical protein L0229_12265 [Blastocatellia bacterium]|nr:hypothetical protein [Blastocatellia bacterium]
MKIKIDDALIYRDSQISLRYGTGIVTSISPDEYTIHWPGRGLTRYRRSVLDKNFERVFERVDKRAGFPKERLLNLGASKTGLRFNENYDREKVESLCEKLRMSTERKAKEVAAGLTAGLLTKKFALRGAAKTALWQLAELCSMSGCAACDDAQDISRELFFGYVLQKSDFKKI